MENCSQVDCKANDLGDQMDRLTVEDTSVSQTIPDLVETQPPQTSLVNFSRQIKRYVLGVTNLFVLFIECRRLYRFLRGFEIFWENCGYTRRYKLMRRVLIGFLVLILLGISFGIIFGLQTIQY